jgi:hypothetical protein
MIFGYGDMIYFADCNMLPSQMICYDKLIYHAL